jgi:uncharacterized protein (TIGR02466 family)
MEIGWPNQNPEIRPADGMHSSFSTPIWTFSYARAEVVNSVLGQVILGAARTYPSQGRSNLGGWRSRNDLFHWAVPEVKEIGAWILDCTRRIVEATVHPDRYRGTLSAVGWANVCWTGNYNAPHIHPDSAWSGVYYVDAGDPDTAIPFSSCLELLDPRSAAGGAHTPGDPFGHPVRISPLAGLLVLFPSWLVHWVHPHSGRRERIAISFNVSATPENVRTSPERTPRSEECLDLNGEIPHA